MKSRINDRFIKTALLIIITLFLYSTLPPLVLGLPAANDGDVEYQKQEITHDQTIQPIIDKQFPIDSPGAQAKVIDIRSEFLSSRIRPDNVIDDYLAEVLVETQPTEVLEVIIQFMTEIDEPERALMTDHDIEVIHEYSVIPAVYAKATKNAILNLAASRQIYWLEFNEPIEYHMDKSLSVINATRTWNTIIKDDHGNERSAIDGSGVTVVVLDTGIDAGHPDLDYKEKTIMNLKSDFGIAPWVEMENSDTSYGHGTHCAGTVAGNGEASAGARRGVAPGANLIGLSIGDFGVNLANAEGGYDWLYANSKPFTGEPGDMNIRVVSNSWGPSAGKFDPQDSISQSIERCTVDKNVVSVFAAGNSGEDDHDGHVVETNPYSTTPMSIGVAATERDGTGMAYFSSRGEVGLNETWPDVAAPGVGIWSAAARRTYISVMKNLQDWSDLDPYYFAISGTSMATPHVAGAVALLFQACPSLGLSTQHDDFSDQDAESYSGLEGGWWESEATLVHEAELILEASAKYIEPGSDNGVPENNTIGWTAKRADFAQGYGLINVEHAVAIALTLNELRTRDFDDDGKPDFPEATVYDALKQFSEILTEKNVTLPSNKLITHWEGEWSHFTEQGTAPNLMMSTDQTHLVYIPEAAEKLVLNLHYDPIESNDKLVAIAGIRLVIDYDGDGQADWSGSMSPRDQPQTIELSSGGFSGHLDEQWAFNIEGVGFGLPNSPPGNLFGESYYEVLIEYSVDMDIIFDPSTSISNITSNDGFSSFDINDPKVGNLRLGGKSSTSSEVGLNLYGSFFDLGEVKPIEPDTRFDEEKKIETPWYIWLLIALALAILAVLFYRKNQKNKKDEIE